jgi:hypothetical protein
MFHERSYHKLINKRNEEPQLKWQKYLAYFIYAVVLIGIIGNVLKYVL